ncbi:hypothetical protein AC51_4005 [Escherichia coli 5-172-05_S3_C3]|nr:hypothetical protein AB98_2714 [Escherichia coli 1-176-05_S3_C1]KDZ88879.1 hypothetical protein AB45_0152 [Escherichia coli 3-105-05_S1_C2]KEL42202.1 hypothetical protein AC51_4005 [Escherichia coli 5-172-05_S3_C3]
MVMICAIFLFGNIIAKPRVLQPAIQPGPLLLITVLKSA